MWATQTEIESSSPKGAREPASFQACLRCLGKLRSLGVHRSLQHRTGLGHKCRRPQDDITGFGIRARRQLDTGWQVIFQIVNANRSTIGNTTTPHRCCVRTTCTLCFCSSKNVFAEGSTNRAVRSPRREWFVSVPSYPSPYHDRNKYSHGKI